MLGTKEVSMSGSDQEREQETPRASEWPRIMAAYRWPLTCLGTVLILGLLAAGIYRFTLKGAGDLIRDAGEESGEQLAEIAERFRSGSITTTFVAALPDIFPVGSGRLEVARTRVTETFSRTDERRVLWDLVPLGTTWVEIRVPVTYRYHVRMDEPWRLDVDEHTCIVYAPRLRPSLPPAIHTDGMEKRTDSGWLRFDEDEQLLELEQSLTPTLTLYARDHRHLALVREESRKTVARFVQAWLLQNDHWRQDRFRYVIVLFSDEAEDPPALGPSISLPPAE
jgi:hypothetical protein